MSILKFFFHLLKAITDHWDRLHLEITDKEEGKSKEAPKSILLMCRKIPLLPSTKIMEGFQTLEEHIYKYVDEFPDLVKFNNYVIGQWAGKGDILSSFGSNTKTNNASKNLNRRLLARYEGKHPSLVNFLSKLE